MGAPVRCEVHVGGQWVSGVRPPMGSLPGPKPPTGLDARLSTASVLQTVYACQPDDQRLAVVCLDAASRAVYTAQPSAANPVVGIIQHKPTATSAIVVSFGPVGGFSWLLAGQRYFLAADGTLVAPPLTPEATPYVHAVGVALTATELFVMPQWPLLKRACDA